MGRVAGGWRVVRRGRSTAAGAGGVSRAPLEHLQRQPLGRGYGFE
jgi:hypothetical protein